MTQMRFGSYTDDPVGNVYTLLGKEYAEKLAQKFPRSTREERIMLILEKLAQEKVRHQNIIVFRTGLAIGHGGKIHSFTEIAAANKRSRATVHQYYREAVAALKKLIDE